MGSWHESRTGWVLMFVCMSPHEVIGPGAGRFTSKARPPVVWFQMPNTPSNGW